MRFIKGIFLATAIPGTAAAHELPESAAAFERALHHASSLHHLPALLLVVVAAALLYRAAKRKAE